MNKNVFSQAVGMGLAAIVVGSFVPMRAIAQDVTTNANAAIARTTSKLAQMPTANTSAMTLPEGTLVFSQTDRIAVRVYNADGTPRLNWYNKQTGITEVKGAPVTVESTEAGTTYRYAGEMTVEIAIAPSGAQTITLNGTPQQASKAVSGTVFYLPRIALPPNAVVEVSLVDVSRADAAAITLASEQIVSGGRQVPFPFELLYDAGQIDSRYTYAVQSRITVDGKLQFVNTTQVPVINNGSPTEGVQVQVDLVNQDQAVTDDAALTNTVWQLEQIQYNDGKQLDATPGDYTVEFMSDGQLSIRADCNQALGNFTEDGSSLSIDLGPTTLAACPPESIATDYLQALQSSGGYFFQDGDLFIDLQVDTGTMRFSAQDS